MGQFSINSLNSQVHLQKILAEPMRHHFKVALPHCPSVSHRDRGEHFKGTLAAGLCSGEAEPRDVRLLKALCRLRKITVK